MVPKQLHTDIRHHILQSSLSLLTFERAARQTALYTSNTTAGLMSSSFHHHAENLASSTAILCSPPPQQHHHSPPQRIPVQGFTTSLLLAPSVLIAGTAAVYTSALRHGTWLTPVAAFTMLLLALQTSLQPTLSKRFISSTVDKKLVSLVEEIIKTLLACFLFFLQPWSTRQVALADWSLASSLTIAGLPAALYAVQGVLTYTSHQNLDAVTFNGLSQTKTVSAALWCYLLLGQTLSLRRGVAIGILCVSALTFQGYCFVGRRQQESAVTYSSSSEASVTATTANRNELLLRKSNDTTDWWYKGVLPCLGATFLSGLAGSMSQRGLQMVGTHGRNAYLFTIEVSFYSTLCLFLSILVDKFHPPSRMVPHKQQPPSWKIPRWTVQSLIPITLKAVGGILTALVHKYAGTVAKGFALVLCLVLSGIFQSTSNQEPLELHQVIGTLLVLLSTWMHLTV